MLIKGKTLRRRTTILKHSRFLKNLTVVPNFPEELVPINEAAEDGGDGDDNAEEAEEWQWILFDHLLSV